MTSCRESLSNLVLSKWCRKLAVGTPGGEGWAATPTAPAWQRRAQAGQNQNLPSCTLLCFCHLFVIPHLDTITVNTKKTQSPRNKRSPVHSRVRGRSKKGPISRRNLPPPPCSHRPWLLEGLKCTFLPAEASDTLTKESERWSFGGDLRRGCESPSSAEVGTDTAETNPKDAT